KILCGGEALPKGLADALVSRGSAVWNLYGPTETTIWSTLYKIERGFDLVPIGRPIANTQVYLLDADGAPVAVGLTAELFIGGLGLARGYLQRPDLTADLFVPDAFAVTPGQRLYRTGDLARFADGGLLHYVGRRDHQV